MTPDTDVFEIFASYSHVDAKLVKPLLAFLRPAGAAVFRDQDAIPPGKQWAVVIANAIETCRVMYVFWCHHAAASVEVAKEYDRAIALSKDIVPVLLDATPLATPLKAYQWVDLRVVLGAHEAEPPTPREPQLIVIDREPGGDDKTALTSFRHKEFKRGLEGVDRTEQAVKPRSPRRIPDAALQQAARLLSANLESRLRRYGD